MGANEVGERIRRRRSGVPVGVLEDVGSLSLFDQCSRGDLLKVLSLGTTVDAEPRAELIAQGDTKREFFVVVSGTARCMVDGCSVAVLGPGDFFGDVALLNRGPRTATIRAESPMKLLVFSADEFQRLLTAVPQLSARMLQVEAERLRASNSLIGALNAAARSTGTRISGAVRVGTDPLANGPDGLPPSSGCSVSTFRSRPHPARHDGPFPVAGIAGP